MILLVYISFAAGTLDQQDLSDILASSVRRNAQDDITGVLLFHDDMFLQVLEGPEAVVHALVERIRADQRNRDVVVLLEEPLAQRLFPDWAMALVNHDRLPPEQQAFCRDLSQAMPALPPGPRQDHLRRLIGRFQEVVKAA